MGGKPAAFGFDEEIIPDVVADLARHPRLKLSGVHLFAGTQILSAGVLMDQWRYGLKLARSLAEVVGQPLRRIDLGGGLGVPYHEGDEPLDLGALRAGARELAAMVAADPLLAASDIIIEPGRFLAGPGGVYVMTVRTVKTSRGERFLVCDGGMHHHLAASGNLGQVIKRDYPIVAATRLHSGDVAPATVVGPLCTPLDTLGRQTRLAHLKPGDLIAVLQSGAYGLSSSPVGFLSQPTPAEVLVRDGSATLIRPSGTFAAPNTGLTPPPT
jgi:diaminopimelate decarboxylase